MALQATVDTDQALAPARFQTIVVPLDGSRTSERALVPARQLALASGARIVLVHATGEPAAAEHPPLERPARAYLAGWVRRLGEAGVSARPELVAGPPATAIAAVVARTAADLVVMCTHGRSEPGRWIFGSVTEDMLATLAVPLLLVRRSGPTALPEDRYASGLILPLDGSRRAEAILPQAAALALVTGGAVRIVRVLPPEPGPDSLEPGAPAPSRATLDPYAEPVAALYLAAVARRLDAAGVRVRQALRWSASPAEAILEEQRVTGVALIAMTTQGGSGLPRLLCGGTAWEILQRGTSPLLITNPAI